MSPAPRSFNKSAESTGVTDPHLVFESARLLLDRVTNSFGFLELESGTEHPFQ